MLLWFVYLYNTCMHGALPQRDRYGYNAQNKYLYVNAMGRRCIVPLFRRPCTSLDIVRISGSARARCFYPETSRQNIGDENLVFFCEPYFILRRCLLVEWQRKRETAPGVVEWKATNRKKKKKCISSRISFVSESWLWLLVFFCLFQAAIDLDVQ